MNCHTSIRGTAMALACLLVVASQTASAAPGEDPIALEKKVNVQMQPLPTAARSSYIYYEQGIPAWQQARITRYVAKAFSSDTTGIYTEKDVVHAVDTKGSQVVCSQSVGSNVAAAGSAKGSPGVKTTGDQVVVLRGDLVNICW
ncbi:hypothetical protein [Pulveribacter suum]|uniref:Uncharacterized protein n=1 Tax=Pulveribacter suum TaxID=2116657 RepID=A0A2P1NL16_9BURK|nr:hypothetical protein [Pulveribacter suum]AVP57742.1 hypothetical protein C7H73_08765 [Pulveribacter suum]